MVDSCSESGDRKGEGKKEGDEALPRKRVVKAELRMGGGEGEGSV